MKMVATYICLGIYFLLSTSLIVIQRREINHLYKFLYERLPKLSANDELRKMIEGRNKAKDPLGEDHD